MTGEVCAGLGSSAAILYYNDSVTYPDNNVNFETYTDKNILELESLSQIYDLAPGESAESIENWSLYKANGTPDKFTRVCRFLVMRRF